MRIEKCTYKDASRLANLISLNLPSISGKTRPNELALIRNRNSAANLQYFFEKVIAETHAEIYIISDNGQIVGCFELSANKEYENGWLTGEIGYNYILEAYRNHGYGRLSLSFIEKRLKVMHYEKVCIWLLSNNHAAQKFYEHHGFHFDGNIRPVIFERLLTEKRFQKKLVMPDIIVHRPEGVSIKRL